MGIEIPMRPRDYWADPQRLRDLLYVEPPAIEQDILRYDAIANAQLHLIETQRADLARVLHKHKQLFNAELKTYPHAKFHIDLKDDAKPFHAKPYSIPYVHQETFKKEFDRLVSIGVLKKQGPSEWAAGTFIIPKKDNTVRWITDFCRLNRNINARSIRFLIHAIS
jgi:hypothetical protein